MSKLFTWMKQSKLSLLLALIVAVGLLVGGCGGGSDSYKEPTTVQNVQTLTLTPTPLIDADTLKSWMDQGLVNSNDFENVVIFHVGTPATYAAEHIPGAYLWDQNAELFQNRVEGLAYNPSMTVDGATMDAIMQRSGVDKNSVIVLTFAGTGLNGPARAYFHLRYWGFPKERIKFLDGGNNAWKAADWYAADNQYAVTDVASPVQASTFSVRDNGVLLNNIRYSIGEMIQVVDANIASVAATGLPIVNIVRQSNAALTMKTSIGRAASNFSVTTDGIARFKTYDDLRVVYLGNPDADPPVAPPGVGTFIEGLPSISHCGTASSCAPIFFATDAILGWDASIYDGSTSQWNVYAGDPAGNDPNIRNAWNVNFNNRSTPVLAINTGSIAPHLNFDFQFNTDPRANQIENEDTEYMFPAGSGSGGDSGGSAPPTPGDDFIPPC